MILELIQFPFVSVSKYKVIPYADICGGFASDVVALIEDAWKRQLQVSVQSYATNIKCVKTNLLYVGH